MFLAALALGRPVDDQTQRQELVPRWVPAQNLSASADDRVAGAWAKLKPRRADTQAHKTHRHTDPHLPPPTSQPHPASHLPPPTPHPLCIPPPAPPQPPTSHLPPKGTRAATLLQGEVWVQDPSLGDQRQQALPQAKRSPENPGGVPPAAAFSPQRNGGVIPCASKPQQRERRLVKAAPKPPLPIQGTELSPGTHKVSVFCLAPTAWGVARAFLTCVFSTQKKHVCLPSTCVFRKKCEGQDLRE